ncbi:Mth938-like domain-containing protein [Salipiger sp. P9]|mgnify:CR=1 FL=1|uniref:Mth938-like domain-containing protein n=1 Tax=Salipiger pentaromativorans TaxID=2943193 RepID=UPI0021578623|nr:Mth938-like domain-containing protein [Salipiger pentaromativorans]MCR8547024.1 Mth938-like domain-containing protein [Salipiger pentaromativorans]
MQMNELSFGAAQPVDGYGPGFFRVGGRPMDGALCLSHGGCRAWGGLEDEDALVALAGEVDVIFVGLGAETGYLPKSLSARLEAVGVGVEVMNTPSACRTYNVLLGEGRRVALAVLPV